MSVKSIVRAYRDHLKDDAGVLAIVGDKVRLSWAHDDDLPFVIIERSRTVPEHHQVAATGWVESLLTVRCFEASRIKAEDLSTAVREASYRKATSAMGDEDISVRSMMLVDGPDAMDDEVTDKSKSGVFHDMLVVSLWHEQSVPTPS